MMRVAQAALLATAMLAATCADAQSLLKCEGFAAAVARQSDRLGAPFATPSIEPVRLPDGRMRLGYWRGVAGITGNIQCRVADGAVVNMIAVADVDKFTANRVVQRLADLAGAVICALDGRLRPPVCAARADALHTAAAAQFVKQSDAGFKAPAGRAQRSFGRYEVAIQVWPGSMALMMTTVDE